MTLILALIGLALAAASFGWQVWTHLRRGPRVVVTITRAVVPGLPSPDDHVACVTVVNKGDAATSVTAWGFRTRDGHNFQQLKPLVISARVPHRLEAQSSAAFHMPMANLVKSCAEYGHDVDELRGWVRLGTGEEILSPRRSGKSA